MAEERAIEIINQVSHGNAPYMTNEECNQISWYHFVVPPYGHPEVIFKIN